MIATIISIIVLVLLGVLLLKVLKGIIIFKLFFKILSLGVIIILILLGSLAYLTIKDASDFKKKFSTEKNLLILIDKINESENIISVFKMENKTYSEFNDVNFIKESYKKYEFANINEEYYKIFLINTDVLDFINEIELKEFNIKLTGREIKNILISDNSAQALKKILESKKLNYNKDINDEEVKNYLFSYIITEIFNPKNINILLYQIKIDNIVVYENTMLFKSIDLLPKLLLLDLTKKGEETIFNKETSDKNTSTKNRS
ncbi:MAG: hypothetical protein QXL18_04195 [Candidatus Woesearchaeota archaeon]